MLRSPDVSESFDKLISRGNERLRAGKMAEARDLFQKALDKKVGDLQALALLGLAQFQLGSFVEARAAYEELVNRSPDDPSHRLNLGLVYLKLGDADGAIRELEASRNLDPSQSRAITYLALAYARAARYTDAYRAFLQAGQSDLAREVESHLTAAEKAAIEEQLHRPRVGPVATVEDVATALAAVDDALSTASSASSAPAAKASRNPGGSAKAGESAAVKAAAVPRTTSAAVDPEPAKASGDDDIVFDIVESNLVEKNYPAATESAKSAGDDARKGKGRAKVAEVAASAASEVSSGVPRKRAETAGATAISRAVARVIPSATAAGNDAAAGNRAPQFLSDFVTSRLLRPDEVGHAFEIGSTGVLVVNVREPVYCRKVGIDATGGTLRYDLAYRRSRGIHTDETFDASVGPMHSVTGPGYLVVSPMGQTFTAVSLKDDILYLRENLVFAFGHDLRWENGLIPGSGGLLRMIQFRGSGEVAFLTARPLVAIKLLSPNLINVEADVLAGWIGRVVPRMSPDGLLVECGGEGAVLIEPRAPAKAG